MADKEETEVEVQGGGKKKLLIIIAVALVLLIGGGVAAWLLLGSDDEAAETAEGAGSAKTEEVVEEEPLGDPIYHEMAPAFVVNLAPGGRAKMAQVGVQVMTRKQAVVDLLTKHDPMLRHHVFNLLSSQPADDLYSREGREKLQADIKAMLEEQMEKLGLKEELDGIYFSQFVLQ